MDTTNKLRTVMTKRARKAGNVDVCLDSSPKLTVPQRRPLPYPRGEGSVDPGRHRPSPRPRDVTV